MANVIKHKRGSGSDPGASDLIIGELAIRTDTGKLFTKMDSGAIAEIAGGGSDIAINTLSSSSGTGGNVSGVFDGSAYRFTLSAPPNVSAAQLLVSINGVIQKPVAGTGQPSEGFSVDGTDIILGDAPATGSDFFILTFKSLGVSEPADNSVTSAKIVDGAIVNADINASAAIAGSKISPTFTSSLQVTSGNITASDGGVLINGAGGAILYLNDSDDNPDYQLRNIAGAFSIHDGTNSATRLAIDSSGNVGIGTTSQDDIFHISTAQNAAKGLRITNTNNSQASAIARVFISGGDNAKAALRLETNGQFHDIFERNTGELTIEDNGTERLRIDSSGNVGINDTSPRAELSVAAASGNAPHIDIGQAGSNNFKLGYHSGNCFLGASAGAGQFIFKNNVNSDDHPQASGTERMRVDSNGLLLVGLSSTLSSNNAKLQVAHTDGNADIIVHRAGNNANPPSLNFQKTRNTSIGNYGTIVQNNDELGSIRWGGADGSAIAFAARIVGAVDGTPGANDMPGRIQFHTSADGSEGLTERMRIGSNGDITVNFDGAGNQTGQILIADGTASAPGLSFWADGSNDTGIFRSGANTLNFSTGGSERLRIDSSGQVGIGTTSPGNVLDVQGSGHSKILVGTTGTGHATGLQISHAIGDGALQQWQLQTDATADGNLVVRNATSGNKIMIFDSDVYGVSIGGIDPEKMFELQASNNTKTDPLQAGNILRFKDNDSTTTNGQPFGTITWTTNDGGHEGVTGYISCESTNNDGEGRLNFAAGLEADGTLTEVMHCDKEGVAIGGTGLGGDFGPEALRVNANAGTGIQIGQHNSTAICLRTNRSDARATYTAVQWNAQGVGVGSVVVNFSSTNYNTSSDYRIKENVVNLENAISRIKNLKPYRFNFIGDTSETIDGFFAHEAAEVVPNAVTGEKDAVKDGKIDAQSIDNSKLVPLLVAALQEAIGRIEVLEAK